MSNQKIVIIDGDDWMGLYVDDVLEKEGHNISVRDILEHLNIDYEYHFADLDWLEDRGNLPKNLSEVKLETEEED